MPKRTPNDDRLPEDLLTLVFEGGLADNGVLLLPEYAASLDGWRDLFHLSGDLYFHSFPELRSLRGANLLRIEVVAERRGSYEVLLVFVLGAAAGGIIGNRADAATVWTFRKLIEWYREAVSTYVRRKSQTTDYTKIAAALENVTIERGIPLQTGDIAPEQRPLFAEANDPADLTSPPQDAEVDKATVLAERLDQALKHATQPLEQSCERVKVLASQDEVIFEIGPAERGVIASPLTAPPPKRDWQSVKIRFERINRKTGRALFYFQNDSDGSSAHHCHIIDPDVRKAHNRYTQAFNDDALLEVWVRQTHPEKGRLNLQWEVTANDPGEGMLFGVPPAD